MKAFGIQRTIWTLTCIAGLFACSVSAQQAQPSPQTEVIDPLEVSTWNFQESSIPVGQRLDVSLGVANGTGCETDLTECDWSNRDNEGLSVGARWQAASRLALSLGIRAGQVQAPAPMSDLSAAIGSTEDVSLTCELATEAWGELELGLQFSRWQQQDLVERTSGTLSEPGRAAALALGWKLGSFSGGLRGNYTEMSGTSALGPRETLDVNFAWRTPWNASLSVGAKNVLDTRNDNAVEAQIDDLLGRVPYVRYQQDL